MVSWFDPCTSLVRHKQEFEQLEAKLDAAGARKDELDGEIALLSASGRDYEALLAATEQLAEVATQVRCFLCFALHADVRR